MNTLQHYYNRFIPTQSYEQVLFLSGRGLQSAELNEIQTGLTYKVKEIGDAIFRDGDVVSGAECVVNGETGVTTLEAGKVYLRGAVREVNKMSLTLPIDKVVRIGVFYQELSVTELEDPGLRDPAVGTRNYQEPGAARMRIHLVWGFHAEGTQPQGVGEFYPIYAVDHGVLIRQSPPPQLDSVTQALARYDRESNGSYIVKGLEATYLTTELNTSTNLREQVFIISEGKAHVDGYELELPHSLRVRFLEDPDLQRVESEPHIFAPNGQGIMRVNVNHAPLKTVVAVDVTLEKTITLTHGPYSGVADPIPDNSVLEIVQAKQGSTIYVNGSDYKLTSNTVDWSLIGAEPAPGSSYQLTYRYRAKIESTAIDNKGFSVSGAVAGSLILIDYDWMMPRYDVLTLDPQGSVRRVKGLAHPWRPSVPKALPGQLELASVRQTWDSNIRVTTSAVHVIPMSDLQAMRSAINSLYDLIAQERLKNNANALDPAAKKGIFVDPFFDDDMRDQGLEQTAAIVDKELTLPISAVVADTGRAMSPWLLSYSLEPVLEQLLRTDTMKVNPYQAFSPIPAKVTLNLSVDRWTEVETNWSSPVTQRFSVLSSPLIQQSFVGQGALVMEQSRTTNQNALINSVTTESSQLLSSETRESAFMRQATQEFTLEGLVPGETIQMLFDGIPVTPEPVA